MTAALRIGPAFVLGNVMWGALAAAAWHIGLLAPFIGAGTVERPLLLLLGAIFVAGQGVVLLGHLDAADRIAQFLPKAGLCAFLLALLHIGLHADLGAAAGRAAFCRAVIECMGLTCAGVIGLVQIESLIWIAEHRRASA